jgi:hypothetical protein
MNLEQLQAMLQAGEITQEEFDAKVKELGLDDDNSNKQENKGLTEEDIQKLIQSATDKVRSEYSKKLKDIQTQYDSLKNEKLTDEEKFQLEKQKHDEEKRAFEKQKLDYDFTRHLATEKLPVELNDFIPGSDIEKKKEKLNSLKSIIDIFVEEKVKEKFNSQGVDFNDTKKGSAPKTWEQMTLDEKIKFANEFPEEARKYL